MGVCIVGPEIWENYIRILSLWRLIGATQLFRWHQILNEYNLAQGRDAEGRAPQIFLYAGTMQSPADGIIPSRSNIARPVTGLSCGRGHPLPDVCMRDRHLASRARLGPRDSVHCDRDACCLQVSQQPHKSIYYKFSWNEFETNGWWCRRVRANDFH